MTSVMYKVSVRDRSNPRLFVLQFISYKTKVLTLFWDESYNNTSVYIFPVSDILVCLRLLEVIN